MSIAEMPIAKNGRPRRSPTVLMGGAALAALTVAFAGCSTIGTSDVRPAYYDYRVRHPILISEEPEVLTLPVGMNGPALSPEIEEKIRDYVLDYRANGTGGITIQVPVGSANEVAAASTGQAVHYALARAGVPNSRIAIAPYYIGDHSKLGPLRLSYLRVKAAVPRCGVWPEGSGADFRNSQLHNFGCAAQQNLAAMVANPADLVRPQPMGPANGARRAKVITDYSQGLDPKSQTQLIESGVEE